MTCQANNNNNEVEVKSDANDDSTEKPNGKAKIIRLAPLQLCAARVEQLIKASFN